MSNDPEVERALEVLRNKGVKFILPAGDYVMIERGVERYVLAFLLFIPGMDGFELILHGIADLLTGLTQWLAIGKIVAGTCVIAAAGYFIATLFVSREIMVTFVEKMRNNVIPFPRRPK